MLADVLGREIAFPDGHEGSAFGAALLGMQALGLVESIDVSADLVAVQTTVRPEAAAVATYAALLPVFSEIYQALAPTFTTLRQLAPTLPLESP